MNFEITIRDKSTGAIVHRVVTNAFFCVANSKPDKNGLPQVDTLFYGANNVRGDIVLGILEEAKNFASEMKNQFVIDYFKPKNRVGRIRK